MGHPRVHTYQAPSPAWQQGMGQEQPCAAPSHRLGPAHLVPHVSQHSLCTPAPTGMTAPMPLPSGTFTPSLLLLFSSKLSSLTFPPPQAHPTQIPQQLINAPNHHTGTAHGAHGEAAEVPGRSQWSQDSWQHLAATGAVSRPSPHSLDHLGHGDLGVLLKGVHHQAVAADVVHALEKTRVRGGGRQGSALSGPDTSLLTASHLQQESRQGHGPAEVAGGIPY